MKRKASKDFIPWQSLENPYKYHFFSKMVKVVSFTGYKVINFARIDIIIPHYFFKDHMCFIFINFIHFSSYLSNLEFPKHYVFDINLKYKQNLWASTQSEQRISWKLADL